MNDNLDRNQDPRTVYETSNKKKHLKTCLAEEQKNHGTHSLEPLCLRAKSGVQKRKKYSS